MNYYKSLAIILGIVSIGSLQESYRVFTSNAPDIVENRGSLMVVALVWPCLSLFLAIVCWRKAAKQKATSSVKPPKLR